MNCYLQTKHSWWKNDIMFFLVFFLFLFVQKLLFCLSKTTTKCEKKVNYCKCYVIMPIKVEKDFNRKKGMQNFSQQYYQNIRYCVYTKLKFKAHERMLICTFDRNSSNYSCSIVG